MAVWTTDTTSAPWSRRARHHTATPWTLWTTGAIASHAEGLPSALDALLLLAGAVTGFALVGAYAFGSINQVLIPRTTEEVRVWGGVHVPSVGSSILLVTLIIHTVRGVWVWPLVGLVGTLTYLLVIGIQFWLATHRGNDYSGNEPDGPYTA